jgi:CRP/FNR family transcriptional regulator, cyclic AMP receptor protein
MEIAIAVDPWSASMRALQAAKPGAWPSNTKFETKHRETPVLNVQAFLSSTGVARRVVELGSKEIVFTQGDPATSILCIQKGRVKVTVVRESGKETLVAMLGPGDFLGEGCLAGQLQWVSTATTITRSTILVIEKPEMIRLLHGEHAFSDWFIKHTISKHIRFEENLVDQLLNSAEKRLARALLLLARNGEQGRPQEKLTEVTQEMLAEMVGTTRARVSVFMNKFRKLGFIEYGRSHRGWEINRSLLSVVLQD